MSDPSVWFALVGVMVGGLLSFATTSFIEWTRWKRDYNSRWDSQTLDAYINYSVTMKTMGYIAMSVACKLGWSSGIGIPVEEGRTLLREAEIDRANAVERLWVLAPKNILEASGRLNSCLWKLKVLVSEPDEKNAEQWNASWIEFQAARMNFYNVVRAAIALKDPGTNLSNTNMNRTDPIPGWGPEVHDIQEPNRADSPGVTAPSDPVAPREDQTGRSGSTAG
jgi:hypothetical protein